MKRSLIVFVLFSVNNVLPSMLFFRGHSQQYDIPPPRSTESRAEVITNYVWQRLDHFDPHNTDLWSQRYYVNEEYYNSTESNAIFLMVAGEGQASSSWMTAGAWIATAQKYGALLLQLEHRFYGVSHPFEDLSTENLRYLSSRQALEDTATFINAMNEEYNLTKDAKWILFGGSYAGSLVAWLRQKYPHLVQGAMSSSAPLFAQLDFPEYMEVVADDLASYSQECVDVVKTAFKQLEDLIATQNDENITSLFNLCDDFQEVNTELDIASLFGALTDSFAWIAQYNKNSGRTTSIDDLCDILTNETYGDELHRLAEMTSFYYGSSCVDYKYQNSVDYLLDINITASGNMRQWFYQTCTEYGWYQTSSQEESVFSSKITLNLYTQMCIDVYGPDFNESYISGQIEQINTHFGGYDIDVRNVVFVHGSFDPWHPMGLTETTNPESPVIFIDGTAHCANMYSISVNDLPQLTEAREEINRLIGVWLGTEVSGASNHLGELNTLLIVLSSVIISKLCV